MDYNRLAVPGNASIDGDISFGAISYFIAQEMNERMKKELT